MRYFIELAFKGTHYCGWQRQPKDVSVQEVLENALSILIKTPITLVGAGRTDAGVHAKQMYAHFDLETPINESYLVNKLNAFLPRDIAVFKIFKVHDTAHARFDATKRTYHYYINTKKNAFNSNDSWYYKNQLDVNLMNDACYLLKQYTDFECFSKVNTDVNTFNCKISEAIWVEANDTLLFTISADRFLRNMVRAIVGTMVNVGLHKTSLTDFINIIEAKDRSKAGFSVPACGLYLTKVEYASPTPPKEGL